MTNERTSISLPYASKFVDVYKNKMHYIDEGTGDAILFLHGIPTSCYIWRNIMPHLALLGHCLAPDLPGFGHSDKPDIQYSILDYIKYVNEFIERLKLKNITFIMHGWGSLIGLDYVLKNEKNCKGLVFYESFLHSMHGDDLSLPFQEQLLALTEYESKPDDAVIGVELIDKMIPAQVMRQLTEVEMDCYRFPFLKNPVKPILQYLRELPKGDGRNEIDNRISEYSKKLTHSKLPKLLLYSVPGFLTNISTIMWAKESLPNLEIIDIGEELHLGQETYPAVMGEAISAWLQAIEQTNGESHQ